MFRAVATAFFVVFGSGRFAAPGRLFTRTGTVSKHSMPLFKAVSRPSAGQLRAFSEKLEIPQDIEQQAGRRREEIEAESVGQVGFNRDPIIPDVNAGTKENPILIEVRSNVPAVVVPLEEFQRLKTENAQLRQRVQELEGFNASLILDVQERHIEELRRENEELKAQLRQLETRLRHIEDNISYGKLVTSIQDLKSDGLLEQLSAPGIRKTLRRLRNSRNGVAHYFYDDDSEAVRTYKKKVLLQKLREENNASLLVHKQGNELLTFLLSYLENHVDKADVDVLVDADDKNDVENWWLD